MDILKQILIKHHGIRTHPYEDDSGVLSIGVGRNLDSKGLSLSEVDQLLTNDIQTSEAELSKSFDWFDRLNTPRRHALTTMHYTIGMKSLLKLRKTLSFMSQNLFLEASEEMLDTKWADQEGQIALDISTMIKTGEHIKVKAPRSPAS